VGSGVDDPDGAARGHRGAEAEGVMSADPEVLIAALDQKNEHAARLAMLASAAVQVEPELLRALRLRIPKADAGAEADLWFSDLVESRSALGITLHADVRQMLQEQLRSDAAALDAAEEVLLRVHANVSDVIRIEEEVTLTALRGKPDAKNRIDALLAPLVATLESQQHRGLARWAIRAFDAMPSLAKETQAVWRLMRSSSVTRAASGTSPSPTPVEAALKDFPKRRMRLRLRKNSLEIEAARRPRVQVGGTFSDVVEVRDEVISALEARGLDVMFAEFAPGSDSLTVALRRVDEADAFVMILGNRYGHVPVDAHNPGGKSITELEYLRARNRGIPILPLLIDFATSGTRDRRLQALRDEVTRESLVVKLTVPSVLSTQVQMMIKRFVDQLLHFSSTLGTDIEIPDTVPLMLELAWDDNGRQSRRITMQPGETIRQPLRPRNVTVSTFNGEIFALEPELELEDYAVVMGIDRYDHADIHVRGAHAAAQTFYDWLIAPDGGRLPVANVRRARSSDELRSATNFDGPARRAYVYFAGAALASTAPYVFLFMDDRQLIHLDTVSLRRQLAQRAEELVIIIDALMIRDPGRTTEPYLWETPSDTSQPPSLIITNTRRDDDDAFIVSHVIVGMHGAAVNDDGRILATGLAAYAAQQSADVTFTQAGEIVLRRNVFTTASLHFPREMFAAEMQLTPEQGEPQRMQITDGLQLIVRPAKYELAIPEHDYYRTLTFRPGHNDISLGWRFNGKWVIVAGTANPRLTEEQRLICEAIARSLADHGFGLFVGSYKGVDELAARVFTSRVDFLGGGASEVFRQYVQASSTPQFEAVRTVTVEDDFDAPLSEASALIVIGGARGAQQYVLRANERQLRVFAVEGTGGIADEIAWKSEGGLPPINPETAPKMAQSIVETIEGVTPIWMRFPAANRSET